MNIQPFHREDIGRFLALATAERWVAEAWEFDFLLSAFPEGCFSARDEAGEAVGFVTSLRHERSGWIGNLIVDQHHRGKGAGQALFVRSLEVLCEAGVETVWLTASKMGKSLYERHGFASIDTILRWTGQGRGLSASPRCFRALLDPDIDEMGWGDRREALLDAVGGRGSVLASGSGFTVIQPCGRAVQIGPLAALNTAHAALLLDDALAEIAPGVKAYIDAPAGNREVAGLLQQRGFRSQGTNELMYAGAKPAYRPEYIYALATMGSCG